MTILLIILLVLLSASFSCSETSLFSLSRSEVAGFKSQKGFLAKSIIQALVNPRKLLVSILLGNELANVAISILIAGVVYRMLTGYTWQSKVFISIAISTPIIVVISEVIPKNIGIRFAQFLAPACAIFIRTFAWLLSPIRILLLKMADMTIKLFGGNPNMIRSMIMEEEFRQMVDVGSDEGSIGEAEGELIHNVLDLADTPVESIMTPRDAVFALALNDDLSKAMAEARSTQFSRIPIYDSDLDDVVGVLHLRDLFSVVRKRRVSKIRDIEEIIRPAYFIKTGTKLEQLLNEFQKLKVHMAIVTDNNHKLAGVVTMEDLFSSLFEG